MHVIDGRLMVHVQVDKNTFYGHFRLQAIHRSREEVLHNVKRAANFFLAPSFMIFRGKFMAIRCCLNWKYRAYKEAIL